MTANRPDDSKPTNGPTRPLASTFRTPTTETVRFDRAEQLEAADQQAGQTPRTAWCPIWALAMELLDTAQAQPRDQSPWAHLVGAPSSQPFQLAPTRSAAQAQAQEAANGGQEEQTASDCDNPFGPTGPGRKSSGSQLAAAR